MGIKIHERLRVLLLDPSPLWITLIYGQAVSCKGPLCEMELWCYYGRLRVEVLRSSNRVLYTGSLGVFHVSWVLKRTGSGSDNGVVLRTQIEFNAERFIEGMHGTAKPFSKSWLFFVFVGSFCSSLSYFTVWRAFYSDLATRIIKWIITHLVMFFLDVIMVVIISEGDSTISHELT